MQYQAKNPLEGNWNEQLISCRPDDPGCLDWKRFMSPLGIQVISAVELIEGKPQYHISMTLNGDRIPASVAPVVLKQFGAEDWEEDNHTPFGKVRNFWKPITNDVPEICPCKANEEPITEGDYTWRKE